MSKLSEAVSFLQAEFKEDGGNRTIHNVVFLGGTSKNGYTYKQEAMAKAVGLYKGVQCFIGHPNKEEEASGRRDPMRLAGMIENARHEDGRIKGSVKLLDDAYGQKFWNIAHAMPAAASCSHVADGHLVTEGEQQFVDEISEVVSVDLVVNGATTNTVFESAERIDKMDYSKATLEELRRLRPDLCKTLVTEGIKTRDDEVKKLTEGNAALKVKVDDFTVKEGLAKKKADVEKLLAESKLPKAAKTDVFVEQIMAVDGEDFATRAKALIDDRIALVGGVKNMPGSGAGGGGEKISESITSAVAQMDAPGSDEY